MRMRLGHSCRVLDLPPGNFRKPESLSRLIKILNHCRGNSLKSKGSPSQPSGRKALAEVCDVAGFEGDTCLLVSGDKPSPVSDSVPGCGVSNLGRSRVEELGVLGGGTPKAAPPLK